MRQVYNSELHKFVKGYFNTRGANIVEQQDNFFIVEFPGGLREAYTYVARVAAENKDINLLAKGSKALNNMIRECASIAAFSEVYVSYNTESVKSSLNHKNCCDLCPFFTICEHKDKCCDFCSYYKDCNTNLLNADFLRFESIKESKTLNIICFIFLVELSNDYSLSQKVEKLVSVLIDMDTGEAIGNIRLDGLINLDMKPADKKLILDEKQYRHFMNIARQEAFEAIRNQLEVFKKEIEGTLKDKIKSIIDKYEEEYIDNYAKSTLEQLDKLQEEALKLCEREIRGYAINCDYHLKNVILMHTVKDLRALVFRLHETGAEVTIPAEIFLNNVMIRCSECNTEIDLGIICRNGHVTCKTCMEICSACGKSICTVCDDESYICSTCGEIVCTDCVIQCTSCGVVVCPSHSYRCATCGKAYCIDCYEICNVCGNSVCHSHINQCDACNSFVCSDHIHKCSVCGGLFCDNHIHECSFCSDYLCEEHAMKSSYSGKIICSKHSGECSVCKNIFTIDELDRCTICGTTLCPNHVKTCSNCSKVYCSEHINHCNCCGKDYCSCTEGIKCKLCMETYCPGCINSKGLCKACEGFTLVDREHKLVRNISELVPEVADYRKYYLGTAHEVNILYAKNILTGHLVVFNNNGKILSSRKISFIEFLRRKLLKD
ncbi:MAG: hypothetical protein HPY74_09330 [Firmicutes bacterium]|nr:hypothetical protein [Bacillota bacterium]